VANIDEGGGTALSWAAAMVKRVGVAAKRERGSKSAKWVSERTKELGYPISPTVIAKLDSGHRGEVLSIAELLIIAAALDIPPIALLYPDMPDGVVEVIPGRKLPTHDAMLWFNGAGGFAVESEKSILGKLLYLTTRRSSKQSELRKHRGFVEAGLVASREETDDPAAKERAKQYLQISEIRLQEAEEDLIDLNRRINEMPGSVVKDHDANA
jgi:hypothetical protein